MTGHYFIIHIIKHIVCSARQLVTYREPSLSLYSSSFTFMMIIDIFLYEY